MPVIGYGTADFPAFWTRSAGSKADQRLDTPTKSPALLDTLFALGMGGVLIGNPIPEAAAMEPAFIARDDRGGTLRRVMPPASPARRPRRISFKRIFELDRGQEPRLKYRAG